MTRVTTAFELPDTLSARAPAEARGRGRDEVRLLVARPDGIEHARFRDIGHYLAPPDIVVVNTSATLPAALSGARSDGQPVAVHVSGPLAAASYVVELRCADGSCRVTDASAGETVELAAGRLTLHAGHPDGHVTTGSRLWRATFSAGTHVSQLLEQYGRPITYGHLEQTWPIEAYQTVFARSTPGAEMPSAEMPSAEMPSAEMPSAEMPSAEMPSAGRPFTDRLVTELVTSGVQVAPVTLHTGVSSLEAGETPLPERYAVSSDTARRITQAHEAGGRVVAVGTTAARAVESAASSAGPVEAASGWTGLVIEPQRGVRVVGGLVTGWHEPQASHLLLLEAVAGPAIVQASYDAALESGYLWHEFGDAALLLP